MLALTLTADLAASAAPTKFVKEVNIEIQNQLKKPDASVPKLEKIADKYVDFLELAKRALGKEWDKLDKKQQAEFSDTMKGLLRASYAQKAIGQGQAEVTYGKEKISDDEATVATQIKVKKDSYPVDYKLYRHDPKAPWKIYDVVTDEVSLVETYRDQFRKLIAEKGYPGLLSTLKAKKEQLEKQSTQPAKSAD